MVSVTMKDILVYSPPVNEITKKWGVYAIPKLWREKGKELVVRFNGEQDIAFVDQMRQAENLYFSSCDDGESWHPVKNGEEIYDSAIFTGIGSPYCYLKDGRILAFRAKTDRKPITGMNSDKSFPWPDGESIACTYPYGEIPDECKGIERLCYDKDGNLMQIDDVIMDFGEREVIVNYMARTEEKNFSPVNQYLRPYIFKNPYLTEVMQLPDGTLGALTFGQHHAVKDRYCPEVYFIESHDEGITWRKRGTVAGSECDVPFGYSGDGNEMTLTRAKNGDLLVAMRMDQSIIRYAMRADGSFEEVEPFWDCMVARSRDDGYTWEKPFSVSDSSVTPHIFSLENGIVVVVYGRPGVHMKYSLDYGYTWSESVSIIGKTLAEERAAGRDDHDSRYGNTCSYSNTYVEILNEDTFLVLYNNLQYDDGDGLHHKAAFVKRITITR